MRRLITLALATFCVLPALAQKPSAPEERKTAAARNPTWTDPATGLMWTTKDNGSDVSWSQATTYCANLKLGNLAWRLPTLDELQAIDDHNNMSPLTYNYGTKYPAHIKGDIQLTGWIWSSSISEAKKRPWMFQFGLEIARDSFGGSFNYSMRALCVRRSAD